MGQKYLMFKTQSLDLNGRPERKPLYGICPDEDFDFSMDKRGRPPVGPAGISIEELGQMTAPSLRNIKIEQRADILTLEKEEVVENPIGQQTKVSPVSNEEADEFWREYTKRKKS